MERFDRLFILIAVLVLALPGPSPCRAQPPVPQATTSPPVAEQITVTPTRIATPGDAEQQLPSPQRSDPYGSPLVEIPSPLDIPPQPSRKSSLELPPPPGGETVALPLPPLEPGDLRFPINLATALRLADARPLIVAAAQATAWVAEAQLQKAGVLWIPSFMVTSSYVRHDGPIDFNGGVNVPQGENSLGQNAPGSFGKPLNQNLNWFIAGVGLYQVVATTDVIFQPLASRQDLNAKRWDIQTAKNDALMEVARSYFNVHRFRGQYAGALYTVKEGRRLIAAIETISRDLAPAVEVDRARNMLAFLEQQAVMARENWRVASADLTQILRLDPRAVCEPLEHDHLQVTLIDPSRSLDDLIPIGLTNRPELAAHKAQIEAALVRIRQEKMRPLLPSILITGWQTPGGMIPQASIFGTGNGGKLNLWSFRDDISTQMVWQLDSFGIGNAALIKKRRGEQSQAVVALFQAQDAVAAEINQAQAKVQMAASRVVQAERSLRTGIVTYLRNFEGMGQTRRFENVLELIFPPQVVVFALKLLHTAFHEYFNTVADYNTAQFELFHALGYPAREIEFFRPPDGILPINTQRPEFLPAVGTGPPPATR
jgi:outer membrane protein TolC